MLSYFFELEVCDILASKASAPPRLKEPLAASSQRKSDYNLLYFAAPTIIRPLLQLRRLQARLLLGSPNQRSAQRRKLLKPASGERTNSAKNAEE